MSMGLGSNTSVDSVLFRYRSGYKETNAFLAVPNVATPMPALVLASDVFGLDEHIKDLALRFAQQGYAVLAPDFYSTKGGPGPTQTLDQRSKIRRASADTLAIKDVNSGFDYLLRENYVNKQRIGVIGFGYGGTVAMLAAASNRNIAACVNFYGEINYPRSVISRTKPNSPLEMVRFINCPLLALYGAPEVDISRDDVGLLEQELRAKGKLFEIKVYPNAANGFANDTRPEVYRPDVSRDAFLRTFGFLQEFLKR